MFGLRIHSEVPVNSQYILFVANEYEPVKGGIARYSSNMVRLLASLRPVKLLLCDPIVRSIPAGLPDNVSITDLRDKTRGQQQSTIRKLGDKKFCIAVFFNHINLLDIATAVSLKKNRLPSGVFVYGADISFRQSFKTWFRMYITFALQKRVFVISRFTRDRIRRRFPAVKTEIITPFLSVNPETETNPSRQGVISIGRLIKRKGFDVLIKSMKILKDREVKTSLTIIGEGPMQNELLQTVKELNLNDTVTFLKDIDDEKAAYLLSRHRVFCQLPRELPDGDVEGFGIVFLEAAARGLPVVAGRSGGVPDAVNHNTNGYLVDPVNPVEAADKIQRLIEDDSLFLQMSEESIKWAKGFLLESQNPGRLFQSMLQSSS